MARGSRGTPLARGRRRSGRRHRERSVTQAHPNHDQPKQQVMSHASALAALHVAVALFGFAALFGKWVALPATAIVLARTIVAAATLVVVARFRNVPLRRGDRHLLVNGAILAAHWVAFFAAVQAGGVAIALLGYAVFPVFVMTLEHRLDDER